MLEKTKSIDKATIGFVAVKLEVGDKEVTYVDPKFIKVHGVTLDKWLEEHSELAKDFENYVKDHAEAEAVEKNLLNDELEEIKSQLEKLEKGLNDTLKGLITR